ncbi:MAG TPA: aldehyde ferredoxin oxidoreductase family protein [Bacillota bacterium]|nr:aldehyde ferredoxin oxidoreductase family protein [Bacillota bacterium]
MEFGFQNRILRVNLSTGGVSVESPGAAFFRKYVGGRALVSYYLYKELSPGVDPLGPENKLIFAGGVLTGTPFIGGGRNSVGAKSPLTGAYGDSESGGYFGAELRRAGYDALIIEGQSEKPVYISIIDDRVEIKDAGHLWGKLTGDVQKVIQEENAQPRMRVAQIGIAGENLVKYACITNDLAHFYGRSGMGAVMGSKRLRAVAVKGSRPPQIAKPEKLQEINKFMAENWPVMAASLHEHGTTAIVMALNAAGGLPTRNFQEGFFAGAENISAQRLKETILQGGEGCFACPIRCKRVVKSAGDVEINPIYGGPEYETLAALGSNCGVDDLLMVSKGNELCNSLGLDTISTGVSISFAMECFEKGYLSAEQIGYDLPFGDGEGLVRMIGQIARREGFGDVLAEGSRAASHQLGEATHDLAMEVKGQEIPMHEPRLKAALGVGYAISPTGADHCHNLHDTAYAQEGAGLDSMRPLGMTEPLPANELSTAKARMLVATTTWRYFANCAVFCQFVPWTPTQLVDAVSAATGWNFSMLELSDVAKRAMTLPRLFNLREGLTAKDDYLKPRFFEKLTEGPLAGVALDRDAFDRTQADYYEIMGWDKEGRPLPGTLKALGLEWAL